jgi:hypothetical protein
VAGEDTSHGVGSQFKYWFLNFLSCTGKYLPWLVFDAPAAAFTSHGGDLFARYPFFK